MKDQPAGPDGPDFSLIRGGPWYWLQLWLRLVSPTSLRVVMRATLFAILTWAPLAVLSAFSGTFLQVSDGIGFLNDVATHVRFLVVLPSLILAEAPIDRYTALVVKHLRISGLVGPEDVSRFNDAIRRTTRLRDSWIVAIALVAFGVVAAWSRITQIAPHVNGWMTTPGAHLQPAGIWLGFVATPLFVTIFLRSLWRFALWSRFLFVLSRTRLNLSPGHPDRMGGLGSLQIGQQPFASVFFAVGALVSATIANLVLHGGYLILDFKWVAVSLLVIAAVVYLAPLLAFAPQMILSKRTGVLEYDHLSAQYTRGFEEKWIASNVEPSEPLLGTADIQSLADIGNSFERVQTMRSVPLDPKAALVPVLAAGLPLLPLALMVMPLKDLLQLLMKAVI